MFWFKFHAGRSFETRCPNFGSIFGSFSLQNPQKQSISAKQNRPSNRILGLFLGQHPVYIYISGGPAAVGWHFFQLHVTKYYFSSISAIFLPKIGPSSMYRFEPFLGYPSETRILEHFLGRNQGGEYFGFRVDSFTIVGCKKWIGRRFAVSVCSFSYLFTLRMIRIPCSETAYRVRNNGSVQNVYRVLPLDWNLFTNEGSN